MDANFWHERWSLNQISFHENNPNGLLVDQFEALNLASGARVFLPLCGKTRDIAWLLERGYRVAGAELSETAIAQLFDELGVKPVISELATDNDATTPTLKHYAAKQIDMFTGDIFALTGAALGAVDAVYDRAALVALPADMRVRYASHVAALTGRAPQLLICFEYDQAAMPGPPFSISADEVKSLYGENYQLRQLTRREVAGGLKGRCAALEVAWLIQRPDQAEA